MLLSLCAGAILAVRCGERRLLRNPEAAGLDHFGLDAPGHERGSVLALYSDGLLLLARGLQCAVLPQQSAVVAWSPSPSPSSAPFVFT